MGRFRSRAHIETSRRKNGDYSINTGKRSARTVVHYDGKSYGIDMFRNFRYSPAAMKRFLQDFAEPPAYSTTFAPIASAGTGIRGASSRTCRASRAAKRSFSRRHGFSTTK